ncbi:hypothetical protein ASG90_17085 [Nocardioides sp. Soil797]|nr:hypothetical protein ASG90_17085 [Nocardioides sp. Soil797]
MSSPTTRRRPTRDQVRRALLDAAAEVFARRGIDGASLDEVAAAAGFTKGALYSNFASKAALIDALAEDHISTYVDLGLAAVSDPDVPMTDQAKALGDRLTKALDERQDAQVLFLDLWARSVRQGEPDQAFLQRRRELHAFITRTLEEHAERAGTQLPLSAEAVATVLMALANGLAIERRVAPQQVPDDLFGQVLAMLVRPAD